MRGRVFVELDSQKRIIRIYRRFPHMTQEARWSEVPRIEAVAAIREQVIARADEHCEYCGHFVHRSLGHMHEKIFRSQGGEISLANSVWLCPKCHDREHRLKKSLRKERES